MSDDLPKEPKPFDPELEATIRRNVAIYWDADAPYERRIVARHALQALAVEGFKELLFVVDLLRSDSALQHSRGRIQSLLSIPKMEPIVKVKTVDLPPELAHMLLSGGRRLAKPEDDK